MHSFQRFLGRRCHQPPGQFSLNYSYEHLLIKDFWRSHIFDDSYSQFPYMSSGHLQILCIQEKSLCASIYLLTYVVLLCVSCTSHLLFLYMYLLVFDGHSHISSGHSRISRIRGNSWPFVRCRTLWGLLYPSSAHSSSVSTTLMAFIAIGHLHRLLSHRHFSWCCRKCRFVPKGVKLFLLLDLQCAKWF